MPRRIGMRLHPLVRILSVPLVAVVLLLGGWVTGGLISNDFRLSMVLEGAWVTLVGLVCLVVVLRHHEMWPALAAFAITATAAGAYLGAKTLVDDKVAEKVVAAKPAEPKTSRSNVLLGRGSFESLEHGTSGLAQTIAVRGERRVLTLTRFSTSNGPDLRVYLATADANQDSRGRDFEDLGALKGNIGDQQYDVPRQANLARLTKVLVWCRTFSVGFGAAPLRRGAAAEPGA